MAQGTSGRLRQLGEEMRITENKIKSSNYKKPNGLTAITCGDALRTGKTPKKMPQRGKSKQIKYKICHNHYQ